MVSVLHEAILLLMDESPRLAAELLTSTFGVTLPSYTSIHLESFDFSDIKPATYHADRVALFYNEQGCCVFACVLEVQLSPDSEKWWSWPVYVATVRAKYKCPTVVMALAPTNAIAEWCHDAVDLGNECIFAPLVIGPASIPVVNDIAVAQEMPELCVLSAIAHGQGSEGQTIAETFAAIAPSLDDRRKKFYTDIVRYKLNAVARQKFEELMELTAQRLLQSGLFKEMIEEVTAYAISESTERGLQQGLQQGTTQGQLKELQASIRMLCQVLDVKMNEEREAYLQTHSIDELHALQQYLVTYRRWI